MSNEKWLGDLQSSSMGELSIWLMIGLIREGLKKVQNFGHCPNRGEGGNENLNILMMNNLLGLWGYSGLFRSWGKVKKVFWRSS